MKRGEIWTVAGGSRYASKPRPVVILQDDRFDNTDSITVCGVTSVEVDASYARLRVEPSPDNGLRSLSYVMADKVLTVPRSSLGKRVGKLHAAEMVALSQLVVVFLALAG
jgi:mRNA interferase MazF